MSANGRDLAAALQTINEIGDKELLARSIQDEFPDTASMIHTESRFSVAFDFPGLRDFIAHELSDGTLRYLCLLASLSRPPSLIVLNEPEASLHPDLMGPLGRLIAQTSEKAQLWITTHSEKLAQEVKKKTGTEPIRREKVDGETQISRQADT